MDFARQDFTLDVTCNSDSFEQPAFSDAVGTVKEIPNPNFALVNVPSIGSVMCFRGSLKVPCRSLKDVLKIGDSLNLRMRYGRNNEWLVLSASFENDEQSSAPGKQAPFAPDEQEVIKKEIDVTPYECKPGEHMPLSKRATNVRFLINWPGYLTIVPETGIARVSIKHVFGCSVIDVNDPLVWMLTNNEPMDCASLGLFLDRYICFNAVWGESVLKIEKIWFEKEWSSQSLLLPELSFHRAVTRPDTWYCGTITSIPYRDAAIASVGDLPVFVPIESLVTEDLMNPKWTAVSMFVDKGSSVTMEIKQSDEGYFRAEKCLGSRISKGVKIESHLSKWGPVEKWTKEGVLELEDDDTYVVVDGWSLPVGKDKIFVSGKQATPIQLNAMVGREVTCIICEASKQVVCAWSGCTVAPFLLLKEKLVVPKGIVNPDRYYDAVVEEFPLPGHAIGRIGVVPLLMPITDERDLKRGDVMSVCVEEKEIDGDCYLVCKSVKPCANESLLLNFRGRVVDIGTRCTIKCDDNFEVNFEWSAVSSFKSKIRRTDNILTWFKRVREIVKVGTSVQFGAKIPEEGGREDGPYSAVEICVDDEP